MEFYFPLSLSDPLIFSTLYRYRESIKKTGRTVPKIGEFGKECAAKWNSMNEEEKKPFTEVAARDRDR